MLANPIAPVDQKKALIDKMLQKGTTHKFCNFLVDKQRIDLLPQIIGAFETLYNEKADIKVCTVTSACTMTEDQLFNIAQTVQKQTGAKSVKIKPEIDESLIGGFTLVYGAQKVDLSIRSGLEEMR